MCSGSLFISRWRSWSIELAISAGESPCSSPPWNPEGTAAPPVEKTETSPVGPPPRGLSCESAWAVGSGTEPRPLTSTGMRVGGPARTDAAIPACQSSSGTRMAACSGLAPGAGGCVARAAAAASAVGSGPLIRVVFRVATRGNPRVPTGACWALSVATAIVTTRVSPSPPPPNGLTAISTTTATTSANPAARSPLVPSLRGSPTRSQSRPRLIGRGTGIPANATRVNWLTDQSIGS
jgi:hypothetical protein